MTASTRKIELSCEQQAAIFTPGNLLLRAGAGSGKTEVLARRFAALVAGDIVGMEPLEPATIAAITFTEKAALDMSARIAMVVAERIGGEQDPDRRALLTRAQRRLWLARISTIHAFCARMLRENAAVAGIDPDFEVLDDYESQTFFERVALQRVVDAVRRGDPGAQFLVHSRGLRGSKFREGAVEVVERIITEAQRRGQTLANVVDQTAQAAARLAGAEDAVAVRAGEITLLLEQLCKVRVGGQTGDKLAELRPWWKVARAPVARLNRSSEIEDLDLLRELLHRLPEARSNVVKKSVNRIRELVDKDKNFGLKGDLVAAWGEYRATRPALEVAGLIADVDKGFAQAKRSDRVMTFDDLLIVTRDLLQTRPDVTARYRRELRVLLIDEYQDTNGLQDQIVALLTDPDSQEETPPQVFIVGDEKQSIYRFRGADVTVFNSARAAAPRPLPLPDNRRSTPSILNFVNALGASMMRASDLPASLYQIVWSPHHELRSGRQVAHDRPVEVLVADYDNHGADADKLSTRDKRIREAQAIASLIRDTVSSGEEVADRASNTYRPAGYGDIVVLLRAFSDIALYERAFTDAGIDFYTVNGRGFYGRPEVVDLVQLMAAIADPCNTIALAAALRSPLFGFSDRSLLELCLPPNDSSPRLSLADWFAHTDARPDFARLGDEQAVADLAWITLDELWRICSRVPLSEFIQRVLDLTDYESVMAGLPQGRQRVANLRKLVEIARRFDTRRFFTFEDFVSYMRRLTEEEPYEPQAQILGEAANVVRLMTVHQAKGLEFPIVILADIGRQSNPNNLTPLLDPEHGLLVRATCGSGHDEIPNAALERYRERIKDEEAAEQVRVFYVAMTRARDRLIVSEGADKQGWHRKLRELIGDGTVNTFLALGEATKLINCGNAQILLRRPKLDLSDTTPEDQAENPRPLDAESTEIIARRLAFSPDSPRELTISPTALAAFARCPRQYWLRYGLGLPGNRAGGSGQSDAIAMGSVAHRVLETIQFDAEGGEAELQRLSHSIGNSVGLATDQCEQIATDLVRFATSSPRNEVVIGREVPFMLNPAPGLFVRGQIDAIVHAEDKGAENRIVVRDYKYSTVAEASLYQVQMEAYALAVATAYPDFEVAAEIIALRGGTAISPVALPDVEAMRDRIATLGDDLYASNKALNYPIRPPTSIACRSLRCEFVDRCWNR